MKDQCYQCQNPLIPGHISWFCNEYCKNEYWKIVPEHKTTEGSKARMKAWMAEQKKKRPQIEQQQEMEHLVSIYREEF